MNTPTPADYETILQTVHEWPPVQRFTLVQDILKTLSPKSESPRPRQNTLEKALGLLATNYPAPSDVEVKQWLNEHRTEKYG